MLINDSTASFVAEPSPDAPNCHLLLGDARQVLIQLPDDTFNACVTSPPYWGLRDYGIEEQIGAEMELTDYLAIPTPCLLTPFTPCTFGIIQRTLDYFLKKNMANIFTNEKVNTQQIQMSNGSTSVFIETLCLAGADIAEKDFEKDIMIWLGQRDWVIIGMGMEGFDMSEIIWNPEYFDNQKSFILRTIDRVFEEVNWSLINYQPNREWLFRNLESFREMISAYEIYHIDISKQFDLFEFGDIITKYEKCDIHTIYKHTGGCVICNG